MIVFDLCDHTSASSCRSTRLLPRETQNQNDGRNLVRPAATKMSGGHSNHIPTSLKCQLYVISLQSVPTVCIKLSLSSLLILS